MCDSGLAAQTEYSYRLRAYSDLGTSAYSNVATATTDEPEKLHVGDIDGFADSAGGYWSATVTVTIHDEPHLPEEGVYVYGSWSGYGTNLGYCLTGPDGSCQIAIFSIPGSVPVVTFTVTAWNSGPSAARWPMSLSSRGSPAS